MRKFSDYISVSEAAEFLGVKKTTLQSWDNEGKLISLRHPINRYRLYLKEDLQALLEKLSKSDKI